MYVIMMAIRVLLVAFFFRSAYRKFVYFNKVSDEFRRWNYPFPKQITVFLIVVWVVVSPLLLPDETAWIGAAILSIFMGCAWGTLLLHREWVRLWQPTVPLLLLACILVASPTGIAKPVLDFLSRLRGAYFGVAWFVGQISWLMVTF